MVREARLKITREMPGTLQVRKISSEGVLIGEDIHSGIVAVTGEGVLADWPQTPLAEINAGHFDAIFELEPELVILGTGSENVFPPRELMFAFARKGVGLEVMDSAAAARTFNVLAGEGRPVAAVLYPA